MMIRGHAAKTVRLLASTRTSPRAAASAIRISLTIGGASFPALSNTRARPFWFCCGQRALTVNMGEKHIGGAVAALRLRLDEGGGEAVGSAHQAHVVADEAPIAHGVAAP